MSQNDMFMKLSLVLAGGVLLSFGQAASAATVSLFCSASGSEYELCSEAANAWASETGNEVKINKMPASWDEALLKDGGWQLEHRVDGDDRGV